MKRATLMLAVLAMTGVASAGLIIQTSVVPITFEGQDYLQFTVTAVGTGGDVLARFDGRFDGPMNQLWTSGGGVPTPINSTALGGPLTDIMPADQVAADTHLLLAAIDLVVTGSSSAMENLDMGSPETKMLPKVDPPQLYVGSVWGPGTWLAHSETAAMAFGIEAASRMTERPLAQIVVPLGQSVQMVGIMADQAGIKYPVDITLVPEPATMGLLAVGCVALVIRRRNRR